MIICPSIAAVIHNLYAEEQEKQEVYKLETSKAPFEEVEIEKELEAAELEIRRLKGILKMLKSYRRSKMLKFLRRTGRHD